MGLSTNFTHYLRFFLFILYLIQGGVMENLKLLRKNSHYTQSQMAQMLNLSLRGYQDIENGVNETSYTNIFRIADFFGCSIDYLLGHQTANTLQLEGLTDDQKQLISIVQKLDARQTAFAIGYFSDMLGLPYTQVKPARPF